MNERLWTDKFAETCGHCGTSFEATATSFLHPNIHDQKINGGSNGMFEITVVACPNKKCQEPIIYLDYIDGRAPPGTGRRTVYPSIIDTKPPRLEGEENVPETIRQYWQEAWIAVEIIPISAGAIVRLLLEKILLHKKYGKDEEYPTLGKLMKKAEEDSNSGIPESDRKLLFPTIRDIAQIGNSAAHDPIPVGKAEDYRDALKFIEEIIGWYYVRPAKMKRLKAVAESRETQRQAGKDEQLSESDAVPRG